MISGGSYFSIAKLEVYKK